MHSKPLLLIVLAFLFSSCLPVYLARNYRPAREMNLLDIPRGGTVRAVHGDPGNPVQLFVERALADAGFTVYSNGLVSASVPVASLRYETGDTTVFRTERGTVYQRLYEDPDVQYLLKYSYSGEGASLYSFSASLVYADNGELIGSYSDTYAMARGADRVMEDFTESLIRSQAE
ncbi:hypothetical protein CLV84_3065 [Neolewinella xylanilytica]|uniref:Uncharacterized protein n=1 Tax=Neolewinella xylanilytica TaxID=1514080 RepID=A0A2S6I4N8_9BACT|nr:hypothetical protein [Neolewinella xylanilytica]PPK86146.1 hypothetical protein CLV84_3065 [Neolewinella xylanilytica]